MLPPDALIRGEENSPPRLTLVLATVGAYGATAALVVWLYATRTDMPFVYFANGVYWAALLLATPKERLPIALGVCGVQFAIDQGVYGADSLTAAIYAASKALEGFIGALLVRRILAGAESSTLAWVASLILVGAAAAPLVFALPPALARLHSELPVGLEWVQWALVQASGMITTAPALLLVAHARRYPIRLAHPPWELILVCGGAALLAWLLLVSRVTDHPASLYLLSPPLFWAAARFGLVGAISINFIMTVIATLGQLSGTNYFLPTASASDLGSSLCLYLLVNSAASLLMGASSDDRRAQLKAVDEARVLLRDLAAEASLREDRYRASTAEILHDSLGQLLALGRIRIDILRTRLGSEEAAYPELSELDRTLEQALTTSRSITSGVAASVYQGGALDQALERVVDTMTAELPIAVTLVCEHSRPINHNLAAGIFRCVRELLVNVIKHARASTLAIEIREIANQLHISVRDNGQGFATPERQDRNAGGYGLRSCRNWLETVGGSMCVESAVREGTRVDVKLPLSPQGGQ